MVKWMLYLGLVLPLTGLAQVNLRNMPRNSYQAFVYRIGTERAEWCIRHDSLPVDDLLSRPPFAVFPADSVDDGRLPTGQYVLVLVKDNRLISDLLSVSDLIVYPVNDRHRVRLLVRRRESPAETVADADVRVNGRPAAYLATTHSYVPGQRHPDHGLVRVAVPGDTTFLTLDAVGDGNLKSPWRQRLRRSLYRVRSSLARVFRVPSPRYGGTGEGTVLFSQPKYKRTDTVRLKAYILDHKNRRYRSPLDLYLEYTRDGSSVSQPLGLCPPPTPGSFLFQFALSDTLPSDTRYTIAFRDRRKRTVIQGTFPIEEYLLDQVTDYRFRAENETVYRGDSLRLLASATDAGGLPVLDAKVRLVLLRGDVTAFDQDSIYVPDTLMVQEKPLAAEGETALGLDTRRLPVVDMNILAQGAIIDADGERHDQSSSVVYAPGKVELLVRTSGDSVSAAYRVNGRVVPRDGFLRVEGMDGPLRAIHYPLSMRIDPFAGGYMFYLGEPGAFTDSAEGSLDDYEVMGLSNSRKDTLGFVLENPRAVPISYTVTDGNRLVDGGWSDAPMVTWSRPAPRVRDTYQVAWQYRWKGEEHTGTQKVRTPYRALTISLEGKHTVFPGQTDTLRVRVTDVRGRPDPHVDLAAYSYNAQFEDAIRYPRLVYLARYRNRPTLVRASFEGVSPDPGHGVPLGQHQGWIHAFGLDSMTYYQMLYPRDSLFCVNTHIPDWTPEMSVYVVRRGVPQRVYLLYLNLRLVYYDGVTDPLPYVFGVDPTYTKIGVRLHDQYIELDSVYAQPFYRRDVVIDLDHLPPGARSRPVLPYYSPEEAGLLRSRLWQMRADDRTRNGYVWQGDRVVRLGERSDHLVGPFDPDDSLYFFAPGYFDSHFRLETGYRYELSPQILRLEKNDPLHVVKGKVPLDLPGPVCWALGDTLPALPEVGYGRAPTGPFLDLETGLTEQSRRGGYGSLMVRTTKDTLLQYLVLFPERGTMPLLKLNPTQGVIGNIDPGTYTLLLVDRHFHTAERRHLLILPDRLLCVHTEGLVYTAGNPVIAGLAEEARERWLRENTLRTLPSPDESPVADPPSYPDGPGIVWGRVIDAHGKLGIVGASVLIKGSKTGTVTDKDGYFHLKPIRPGRVTLMVLSVGYKAKTLEVMAGDAAQTVILLEVASQSLNDVVVVGYGMSRKRDMTGSVSGVDVLMALPGVHVTDSIMVDLIDAQAKTLRTEFRDFGFWQPRFLTDAAGNAEVTVTYPDNITGWRNFVVGMDRSRRMGYAMTPVVSFKPLVASLGLPAFLVEGDRAELVGKVLNYTAGPYNIRTSFGAGDTTDAQVGAHASVIRHYPVLAAGDSLRARFTLQTGSYGDGEQRSLPVYPKGVAETTGSVYLLEGDTAVMFHPRPGALTLYARNNTLDILLDQLRYLRTYPYFCMEQTSSKLTGLLAEKKIDAVLDRPFDGDKDIADLTRRLEKGQLYSGGWSWWEGGEADRFITCYVIRALLPLRSDPMVAVAVRNGLLYLQNSLPGLAWRELSDPLRTMSEAGHVMDYQPWIGKIRYDSLDQHGQWVYVRMLQALGRDYREALGSLLRKGRPGMLGSLHWGEENQRWYGDDVATTVLAYRVLSGDSAGRGLLPAITRYFLEGRYAYNTVQCASIVSTILPEALLAYKDFTAPATLRISGDTTFTVTHFPFTLHTKTRGPWTIQKTGGGLTYLTLYQEHWEEQPQKVDSLFWVQTHFVRDGRETDQIVSGERVTLRVSVAVMRDAEYTMIEVPIPAGCTYADKRQDWETHKEFLKDRVVIFARSLSRGVHVFEIPLEVRYSGTYTLNPARVALMYFPVLYGRNGLREVVIGR